MRSGVASASGRLEGCRVCTSPSDCARYNEAGAAARHGRRVSLTSSTGHYAVVSGSGGGTEDDSSPSLQPSTGCSDHLTGIAVLAPARCGATVCSAMTDVAYELRIQHALSSLQVSSLLSSQLLGLPTMILDIDRFDGTSAAHGRDGYVSIAYGLGQRLVDAWERVACGVVSGLMQRRRDYSAAAAASERRPGVVESSSYVRSGSVEGPNDLNAAVTRSMRARLAASLVAQQRLGVSAAYTAEGAQRVARLFSQAVVDTTASMGLNTTLAEVVAPAAALGVLVRTLLLEMAQGAYDARQVTTLEPAVTIDGWFRAQVLFAHTARETQWLALRTHDLLAGNLTTAGFSEFYSRANIAERLSSPRSSPTSDGRLVVLACLDPRATTYDALGDLGAPSQCLYTSSHLIASMETMNTAEWLQFITSLLCVSWLSLSIFASFVWLLCTAPVLRARGKKPVDSWPEVAVLVPCYMPNEQKIIEETLEFISAATKQYPGELSVYVPYNCPPSSPALPVEERLGMRTELGGRRFRAVRVPGSSSKAHNLDHALKHMLGSAEMCVIFDADHQPRPQTIQTLVATLVHNPHLSAAQGSVLIERGGPWLLRNLADGMEWSSWTFWGPGFAQLAGSAYFGGGNAAWRADALASLGFDSTMLTEDIDVSIRALALGHRIQFVPWAQVGELCPPSLSGFYKQRLRWAMGWEQVTARRLGLLFNSTRISEPRKWRTCLILLMRYWSITTALFSLCNILITKLTPHPNGFAPPIEAINHVYTGIMIATMLGCAMSLFALKEPLWRWRNVFAFIPISLAFFMFSLSLIVISFFQLTCRRHELEWVPTAREHGQQSHRIKMAAHANGEGVWKDDSANKT